jgi:2-oxoisovalerate dehydrogenase E1 component
LGPYVQEKQSPGKVAEDADRPGKAVPLSTILKIIDHGPSQTEFIGQPERVPVIGRDGVISIAAAGASLALSAGTAQAGSDVTVVGITVMVQRALAAADALAREGVSVEVIDPRTLAPLDLDTILESVHKTGRLLVADESYGPCGIGAEIAAQVADRGFDDLDAPIRRLNGLHAPIPYSPPLEKAMVPDVDAVVRAIRDLRAE